MKAVQLLGFLFMTLLAIAGTGCGESNNKGKIVGKWSSKVNGIEAASLEFTSGGDFTMKIFGSEDRKGTYSLSSGDTVYMTFDKPIQGNIRKSKETISINGDTMTMAGDGGKSTTFSRVK